MSKSATEFHSTKAATPAVTGKNKTAVSAGDESVGVYGESDSGFGVFGFSTSGRGVVAESTSSYGLRAHSDSLSGIRADSNTGVGIEGASKGSAQGVVGSSVNGDGVWGVASNNGTGVAGTSLTGIGVHARTTNGIGVLAESEQFEAVRGVGKHPDHGAIVAYHLNGGIAVFGRSHDGEGVHGETDSLSKAALVGLQTNAASLQPALYASHAGVGLAADFVGSVRVSGDITLGNADCAEEFDVAHGCSAEPGTVMVLHDEYTLEPSSREYDTRVAGVVSGAGSYKPAIVLDRQAPHPNRVPVALLGKVFCRVDATFGEVRVGDLLTTSPTPGCAMRVSDPQRALGAVIGKALRPLSTGQQLIPVLIALQ